MPQLRAIFTIVYTPLYSVDIDYYSLLQFSQSMNIGYFIVGNHLVQTRCLSLSISTNQAKGQTIIVFLVYKHSNHLLSLQTMDIVINNNLFQPARPEAIQSIVTFFKSINIGYSVVCNCLLSLDTVVYHYLFQPRRPKAIAYYSFLSL